MRSEFKNEKENKMSYQTEFNKWENQKFEAYTEENEHDEINEDDVECDYYEEEEPDYEAQYDAMGV